MTSSRPLDDLREQIRNAVEDMLVEQAASIAVGIALSFVTAGTAAAAAAGVTAERITSTARKIRAVIHAIEETARVSKTGKRVGQAISDLKGRLDEIAAKLPGALTGRATELPPPKLQTTYAERNLQKNYTKHAQDFGVTDPWSRANAPKLKDAIEQFIDDPANIEASFPNYHGQGPANIVYNPTTHQIVVRRPDGELWSAFRMNDDQWQRFQAGGAFL